MFVINAIKLNLNLGDQMDIHSLFWATDQG